MFRLASLRWPKSHHVTVVFRRGSPAKCACFLEDEVLLVLTPCCRSDFVFHIAYVPIVYVCTRHRPRCVLLVCLETDPMSEQSTALNFQYRSPNYCRVLVPSRLICIAQHIPRRYFLPNLQTLTEANLLAKANNRKTSPAQERAEVGQKQERFHRRRAQHKAKICILRQFLSYQRA